MAAISGEPTWSPAAVLQATTPSFFAAAHAMDTKGRGAPQCGCTQLGRLHSPLRPSPQPGPLAGLTQFGLLTLALSPPPHSFASSSLRHPSPPFPSAESAAPQRNPKT
eukprot:scaffold10715_cov114-Isochrysis_galbana.AAC.14